MYITSIVVVRPSTWPWDISCHKSTKNANGPHWYLDRTSTGLRLDGNQARNESFAFARAVVQAADARAGKVGGTELAPPTILQTTYAE